MNQKTRQEQDSIGKIKVSNSNFWGAQTQRSLKNFKIGNNLMPIEIIHALVTIKMACAKVNQKQKSLAPKIANAIISASKIFLPESMMINSLFRFGRLDLELKLT